MKIFFLFLSLIFSNNYLFSQSNLFNKYYNPKNTWAVSGAIYPIKNGYVCASLTGDSVYYYKNNILILKIDTIGTIINYKEIKLDSCNYYIGAWGGRGFAKCNNGNYILSGDIQSGNINGTFIMKLKDNLDTLWSKIYNNDTIFSAITQCIETSDKGIILCGQKQISASKLNVLLIKDDSLGNKLWEKTYDITGYNGDDFDKAWNVCETPDKGFLLGCYTYSNPSLGMNQGSGDGVVIKTDSMGFVQWTKNLGGPQSDGGVTAIVCNDGNYLFATVYSYFTADYNDYYSGKLRLMKVTPSGNIIYDRQYEPEINSLSAMKIIELPNRDIVIGGTKWFQQPSEFASASYGGYYNSYLYKLNADGDSIWYREYAKISDTLLVTWNRIHNIEITPDGGIIACGQVFENTIIPQSIWIFKTDSMGCLQPGCQYVGIEKLNKVITELTVYPNPAIIQATITYPTLKTNGQLQIYNMLGQKVYEEILNKNTTQTILDTKDYKRGLYMVVLREGGVIKGQASLVITK